jgi:transcriptional regulator with XRE-family HTH domain
MPARRRALRPLESGKERQFERLLRRASRLQRPPQPLHRIKTPGRELGMQIGERLRELRTVMSLSQGEIERRTGLHRCYISRVENGYTVPNVQTLEKWARALELPLYKLFYVGDEIGTKLEFLAGNCGPTWGERGNEHRELRMFVKALSRMDARNRALLVGMAQHMAGRNWSE